MKHRPSGQDSLREEKPIREEMEQDRRRKNSKPSEARLALVLTPSRRAP